MKQFQVNPIGEVQVRDDGFFIKLEEKYIPALQGLDGFGHINVLWWFEDFDSPDMRGVLETPQPYRNAPEVMGMFATRGPVRPNPVALTAAEILHIDYDTGVLQVAYIDANDGTPVLDLKPYTPSFDRIQTPRVPGWCAHWPMSMEECGDFDWGSVFTF